MELPEHDDPVNLANKFGGFFYKKIELVIKTEIDDISVDPPDVHFYPPQVKLENFSSISEDEIRKIICKSSNTSCQLDPIPMWLVKLCCDELVPQGSCLGPVLFLIYSAGLFKIIDRHLPNAQVTPNDTQIYLSFRPHSLASQDAALRNIENCVAAWMLSNRLLINDTKTGFVIIGSRQQVSKIHIDKITVGESAVTPTKVVRSLGVWFDSHMSMNSHIGKVCSKTFRSLYNIRQSRNFLSEETAKIWCILSSPHISITVTHCSMDSQCSRPCHKVCFVPKFDHITPVLRRLHWLLVRYQVMFKILLLVYRALHVKAPSYISGLSVGIAYALTVWIC